MPGSPAAGTPANLVVEGAASSSAVMESTVGDKEAAPGGKGVDEHLAEAVATAVPVSSQGSLVEADGFDIDVGENEGETTGTIAENSDDQIPDDENVQSPMQMGTEDSHLVIDSTDFKELLIDDAPGVYEQLEQSHRLCDKLRIMLEERANVEKSYAASLERLARKAKEVLLADAKPSGFATASAAFDGYIGSVMHRAEQSRQLASDLAGEVVPSLRGTLKQHGQVYQRIRADGMKLSTALQEQYRLHDETVLRYDEAAQRADHLMRELALDTTHDPSSRLRLAIAAAESSRLASGCEESYKKAVHKVNTERQRFVAHMDIIMDALQDMEVKRERCFKDALRKTLVFDMAWVRNVEYDLNRVIPIAEEVDPEGDTAQFARERYAERARLVKGGVGRATLLERIEVLPWSKLQESLHPSEQRREPPREINGVDENEAVSRCDAFVESVWRGDAEAEDSKELVAGLRDHGVRMQFCKKLRSKAHSEAVLEGGMTSLQTLAKTCGVVLDLADQQMDGETAGQIAGVSLRICVVKEDGKKHSLMQELYYHPIWSRVLIWEDILLWAIAESCMAEQRGRAGWPERDAADTSHAVGISNFGEVILHYGVRPDNGKDLVLRCIGRMEEPLGRGAMDDIKTTLLDGLVVAEVKEAQPEEQEETKEEDEHLNDRDAREDVFA
ncbi:conserved hypothetical protein [Perkinsus marinus ATCC 50983]|uniref:F-BAR domain-containing protein n=1 Tax=Perkinsus marinus (strain ATCC 50983 / TXsc) TaxID=423536 RepID=C5L4E5_PERM5|nr:conserved hypothetical protein [Perkinsus marinus ATCC 50983]EER08382.1 conserved hypothetical protein [Perkinsus marinus ATCC 50983]|eukprot:XP_002776566.1 conserved hypothetical protein [Perkinsus marinus ATCC 50983]